MATIPVRRPSCQTPGTGLKPLINTSNSVEPQNMHRHTVANVGDAKQQAPQSPPSGWVEMKDLSGKVMFYNTTNGQTSWQRPVIRALPPGWQKAKSPDGKPMFIHAQSGTISYQSPSDAENPAHATVQQPSRRSMNQAQTTPAKSQSLMHVDINMDVVKAVPGIEQAFAVHQISSNNNSKVLSKQLASDISQAGMAVRDTTITAASLATRQAKVFGKTMISSRRMQKVSKKVLVQTGAMTVHAARACKGIANDMVDAADKRGKYEPKQHRPFVPYDPNAPVQIQQKSGVTITASKHSQPQSGLTVSANANTHVALNINAQVPARKPVRKPVPTFTPGTGLVTASLAATTSLASQLNYDIIPVSPVEKPPIPMTAEEIELSQQLQIQQQNSLAPQSPSQQTVPPQSSSQTNPGVVQINIQGRLQANSNLDIRPVVQLPNLRPQSIFSNPMTPPPSYGQAIRPPAIRPGTLNQSSPSQIVRPLTQRPQYSHGIIQDNLVETIAQTIDQLQLWNSQSGHVTPPSHGNTHELSYGSQPSYHQQTHSNQQHNIRYQHQVHQQHDSHRQQTSHQGYESHQQSSPHHDYASHQAQDLVQQHNGQQGHDAHSKPAQYQEQQSYPEQQSSQEQQPQQQAQPYRDPVAYTNPASQQMYTTGQIEQPRSQDDTMQQNQPAQQQAVYQDSTATAYTDTTGYDVYARQSAVANGGPAVVYDEACFQDDGRVVAYKEVVYVDEQGSVAYEEARVYEGSYGDIAYDETTVHDSGTGEYEYSYEEEYIDAGGEYFGGCEDVGGGEDFSCEMEF